VQNLAEQLTNGSDNACNSSHTRDVNHSITYHCKMISRYDIYHDIELDIKLN